MKPILFSLLTLTALLSISCSKTPPAPAPKVAPANETAPASFHVIFDTSKGPITAEITRVSAPLGVDRFYNLVKSKYFDGGRFFRVVPGFVVQFGLAADPKVTDAWDVPIPDDPVLVSNKRGTLTFATAGPDTRTTQLFINLGNNERLDAQHFSAFGRVVDGMDVVEQIYSGDAQNPEQPRIEKEGNAYLEKAFPNLDYIKTATIAPGN